LRYERVTAAQFFVDSFHQAFLVSPAQDAVSRLCSVSPFPFGVFPRGMGRLGAGFFYLAREPSSVSPCYSLFPLRLQFVAESRTPPLPRIIRVGCEWALAELFDLAGYGDFFELFRYMRRAGFFLVHVLGLCRTPLFMGSMRLVRRSLF